MSWLPPEVGPYFAGIGSLMFAAFAFDVAVSMFRRGHAEVTDD